MTCARRFLEHVSSSRCSGLVRQLPPNRPHHSRRKPAPPPPPKTWIDKLPAKEAADVRNLIRALGNEGLPDAETLVRRHRGAPTPVLATTLIEHRLRALVGERPQEERERAQQLVRRVTEILTRDGSATERPAPRWELVEVGDDVKLRRHRIKPQP